MGTTITTATAATTRTRASLLSVVCVVVVVSLVNAGCTKARAETVPDGPPLAMPAPPPRELVPADEVTASTAPSSAPDAASPVASPARPAAAAAGRTPARTDTPAAAPASAAVEPPRDARRAMPNLDPAYDRKVRDLITRASRDRGRVDYGKLSADGKSQYQQSQRFAEQAEAARKERNYVYAETLAAKAATLAAELVKR